VETNKKIYGEGSILGERRLEGLAKKDEKSGFTTEHSPTNSQSPMCQCSCGETNCIMLLIVTGLVNKQFANLNMAI
jgi:hypothetical protein